MAFVVNRHGATHSVHDDQVEALLAQGFRLATAGEVAAWYAAQGLDVPKEMSGAENNDGGADQPGSTAHRRPGRR